MNWDMKTMIKLTMNITKWYTRTIISTTEKVLETYADIFSF